MITESVNNLLESKKKRLFKVNYKKIKNAIYEKVITESVNDLLEIKKK